MYVCIYILKKNKINFKLKMNRRCTSAEAIDRIRTDSPIRSPRRNLTVKQKLQLISFSNDTNPFFAANYSGIHPLVAYRAITNKSNLEHLPSNRIRASGAGLKHMFPAICEFYLYNKVRDRNDKGYKVSYDFIRKKAKKILKKFIKKNNINDDKLKAMAFSDG